MADLALLALVIDDPLAPKVLAAWKALAPLLADAEENLSEVAILVSGNLIDVRRTIRRCSLAQLIVDGGISPLADQWLSAHIGKQLGIKIVKPKPTTPGPAKEPT